VRQPMAWTDDAKVPLVFLSLDADSKGPSGELQGRSSIPQARVALDRQFRTLLGVVTPTALTELGSRTPSV